MAYPLSRHRAHRAILKEWKNARFRLRIAILRNSYGGEARRFPSILRKVSVASCSMRREPVFSCAVLDENRDAMGEWESSLHDVEDFRNELCLFLGSEVEDELVMDL